MYGSIQVTDASGNTVIWVLDCVDDKARLKSEMTDTEFAASEKAKWREATDIKSKG